MRARRPDGRSPSSTAHPAPALVARALTSPSHRLDDASRATLGRSLGHDLGRLRIHEGEEARAAAAALGARGFAAGADIVLGGAAAASPQTRLPGSLPA